MSSPRNALNTYLSTLNAGISIMVHQVKLMKFLMKMVDYFMSFFMLSNLIFLGQNRSVLKIQTDRNVIRHEEHVNKG